MVRRFHRSIYDELDELRASMDYLFQFAFEPMDNPLLPAGENPVIVCQAPHNLNAEVTENDDEVIITVEIIPGIENTKISLDLTGHNILKISWELQEEPMIENEGHPLHEQRSCSMHHEITLPCPVMKHGAKSSLKHGVFDLRLKMMPAM